MRFIIIGDGYREAEPASSAEILRTLLSQIKSLSPQPDFIFALGDLVDGRKNLSQELDTWKSIVKGFYPVTMFYPVIGNHEISERAFSDAFPHLPYDQLQGFKRTVYYFDYEDSRFIILNSVRTGIRGNFTIDANQRKWLEEVLKSSQKKYHFIMLHVPAFPVGRHFGSSLDSDIEQRNALWKIIDNYKVTAVFAGHEHTYCRRLIDKAFQNNNFKINNSIYHITVGSSSASLTSKVRDTTNIINGPLAAHHFAIIDVNHIESILKVYDVENNLMDMCSLNTINSEPQIGPNTNLLIPKGAEWKYMDDGSDLGTLWTNIDYDDSLWKSGPAELGYGDGNEKTKVSYGPNVRKKYITTYFRKIFYVKNISLYNSLILRLLRDDGAVVYINGKEVFRTNMPSYDINYKTQALNPVKGIDETTFQNTIINSKLLKNGKNIIAVEIHQVNPLSSDISFDLQLLGKRTESN